MDQQTTTPSPLAPESLPGLDILRTAEDAATDKKAVDLRLLDLRGTAGFTDYFLICSGNTERQVKAIHDSIHEQLKDKYRLVPRRVEGFPESRWILMTTSMW